MSPCAIVAEWAVRQSRIRRRQRTEGWHGDRISERCECGRRPAPAAATCRRGSMARGHVGTRVHRSSNGPDWACDALRRRLFLRVARACLAHRPILRATQDQQAPDHALRTFRTLSIWLWAPPRGCLVATVSALAGMTPSGPWSMNPGTSGNLLRASDTQEIPRPRALVAGADQHLDSPLARRALLGGRITHGPIRAERARLDPVRRHSRLNQRVTNSRDPTLAQRRLY